MKRDASTVPSGAALDFDVCIVGAGPAGQVMAEQLSAAGLRVGVLESGGEQPRPETERLSDGRRTGIPYFRLGTSRARAIGGSSWRWGNAHGPWPRVDGMRARPLDALDFEARPHVPLSGWPIGPEELAAWYPAAHERCGLGRIDYDPANWTGEDSVVQPFGGELGTTMCRFAAPDVFRPAGALVESSNVTLLQHANVIGIVSEKGAVLELRVASAGGAWFSVRAREFVLAGGGIENARLLLASPLGRPGAEANRFDQVGRNFSEHLHIESGVLRPASEPAAFGFYHRQIVRGTPVIGLLQVAPEAQRREGLLNAVVEFRARNRLFLEPGVRSLAELAWAFSERTWPPNLAGHLWNAVRQPHRVSAAMAQRFRSRRSLRGEELALLMTSEQAPGGRSRVTLTAKKDRFGVPLPRLHWELAELDYHSIRGTQDVIDRELRAAGMGRIEMKWGEVSPAPYIHGCRHHMGTTRMSEDATRGVVDADCRVHGLENLSIAGSSVMPTGGAVTVTLTAVALALRLAAHLETRLGGPGHS